MNSPQLIKASWAHELVAHPLHAIHLAPGATPIPPKN